MGGVCENTNGIYTTEDRECEAYFLKSVRCGFMAALTVHKPRPPATDGLDRMLLSRAPVSCQSLGTAEKHQCLLVLHCGVLTAIR